MGRLQTAAQLPIPPDPVVLRSNVANAFALPGGRVYVLAPLLAKSETPDELAGVLTHELGHVAHRDGLRRLGPGHEEGPSLLRDHPLTPERRAMLEAENLPASGPALLDDGEWRELKRICDR